MMEQYSGYWISGSAVPGPPYTLYWESQGTVLKPGRHGSLIEVLRLQDRGARFDFEMRAVAEWYGLDLSRIVVDERLAKPRSTAMKRPALSLLPVALVWILADGSAHASETRPTLKPS
jgi:hypothetical protein